MRNTHVLAATAGLLLAAGAAPADSTPPADPVPVPFQPVEDPGWGGQTLVAPRPLYLIARPSAKLEAAAPEGASILYGSIQGAGVAQVRLPDGTLRVYLDGNGDQRLTSGEGILLQKGVVRWPACEDDLSAVATLNGKTAVVWACRAPNVLFWAWRGFLRGEVTVEGKPRPAFLVDGNANGKYGEEKGDLIWIDRDGSGTLDPVTEQFPCAPVLRIGSELYRFSFQAADRGGSAQYSRIERGVVRRRLAFAPELAGRVVGVDGTLLSLADDIIRAESPTQELELPAGRYALTSLTLRVSPDKKPGGAWSYSFSRYLEGREARSFPLAIAPDATPELSLYRGLTLGIEAPGKIGPGEELKIQLSGRSDLGLELTNVRRAGQGEFDSPEDFALITLLDPDGKAVGEAHSGFA